MCPHPDRRFAKDAVRSVRGNNQRRLAEGRNALLALSGINELRNSAVNDEYMKSSEYFVITQYKKFYIYCIIYIDIV